MTSDTKPLLQLPVLSHIQQVTVTQNLPIPKRLAYIVLSTGLIWLVFFVMIALSVVFVTGLYDLLVDPVESTNDVVILSIPIMVTVFALIGFSSHPTPTQMLPEDTLSRLLWREGRIGLVSGALGGLVFSLIWNAAMQIGTLYVKLNTLVNVDFRLEKMLVYGVCIAASVAPTYAIFRTFTAVIGHLLLYWLAKDEVRRQLS